LQKQKYRNILAWKKWRRKESCSARKASLLAEIWSSVQNETPVRYSATYNTKTWEFSPTSWHHFTYIRHQL